MSSSILYTVYKIESSSSKHIIVDELDENTKEVPPVRQKNELSTSLRRSFISGHLVDSV